MHLGSGRWGRNRGHEFTVCQVDESPIWTHKCCCSMCWSPRSASVGWSRNGNHMSDFDLVGDEMMQGGRIWLSKVEWGVCGRADNFISSWHCLVSKKQGGGVVGVGAIVMEGLLSGSAMLWQQRGVGSLDSLHGLWGLPLTAPGEEKPPCRAVLRV